MIFGAVPLDEAEGAILAHSLKGGGYSFKKGRRLSAADLASLRADGRAEVIAARLEAGDVHEDEAAQRLADALVGDGLEATAAFTGRSNLVARLHGLLVVDDERLARLNRVDEAVTVATLPPFTEIEAKQMAATIKIIPFAVDGERLERSLEIARDGPPLLWVARLHARRVHLIQTWLPGTTSKAMNKGKEVMDTRLAALDCPPSVERRCPHETAAIVTAIEEALGEGAEIILVSGASAIVDRHDVVPEGIVGAGGEITHFGMPVDPGNLLLLGRLGKVPAVGLPGCARSPKFNGFDWVLQRLLADIPVTREDVMGMGAGGLLKEIPSRPLPRAQAVSQPDRAKAPRIAGLVLAAGQSRRMGAINKLLAELRGKPMVRHVTESLLASQVDDVLVVTGHEAERVRAALEGLEVRFVDNPDYAEGLSTSLKRGIAAIEESADGVIVCLGDMPLVSREVADRLIAAFDPHEGRAICVPTASGKRGNPVLFARRFFPEVQELTGDIGAKAILAGYEDLIAEVEVPDGSVLVDVDTEETLVKLREDPKRHIPRSNV